MLVNRTLLATLAALASISMLFLACSGEVDKNQIAAAVAAALEDRGEISDRIRARSFELVDDSGNVIATLSQTGPGVGLTLRDRDGVGRLLLALDEAGAPSVTLLDETGTRRVGLDFNPVGNPALFLRDQQGVLKAGLQVQGDGGPLLFFRSAEREDSIALTLLDNDQPVLSMSSPNGASRILLGLEEPDFDPVLIFRNDDGTPLRRLP